MARKPILIVGGGMLGASVSWIMHSRKAPFFLADDRPSRSAAYASGGLLNPRPGRWLPPLSEPLSFRSTKSFFQSVERELEIPLLQTFPLFRPFLDQEHRKRLIPDLYQDLEISLEENPPPGLEALAPLGGLWVKGALRFDWERFLNHWQDRLAQNGLWIPKWFDLRETKIDSGGIRWEGQNFAGILHFGGAQSPLEDIRQVKGQSLLLESLTGPDPPAFVKGRWLIPQGRPRMYFAGSTFEKAPFEKGPTVNGTKFLLDFLDRHLPKTSWRVHHAFTGIRAVTSHRKPVFAVDWQNRILFVSGLGSKGGLWSSHLAPRLCDRWEDILEGRFDPGDLLKT